MKNLLIVLLLASVVISPDTVIASHEYKVSTYSSGLEYPWGLSFSPSGDIYVTEQDGSIAVIKNGTRIGNVGNIPSDIATVGQGGLMDIVFDPQFINNNFIYLSYTTRENAKPSNGINTRVSRFELVNNSLSNEKVLVQGGYGTDGAHFGCRLAFDSKGYLYATFGERHNKEKAQSLEYLNGKVIRIHSDGSIPTDNPYVDVAGARSEIFTLGHRNPQGLDIHPVFDTPAVSEHGPTGYDASIRGESVGKADEVNWLVKGGNYGWPVLFGDPKMLNWTEQMWDFSTKVSAILPVREFTVPDGIAPAGASFYTGKKFINWENDFFVAALRGYIVRLKIDASGKLVEEEKIDSDLFNRMRDVTTGPDGLIYAISGNGTILRIEPNE